MSAPAPEIFGPRLDVRPWFVRDRSALLTLLGDLSADDWSRPTAAAPWTVGDVVAHLLGDDVGRLARTRDGHAVDGPGPDGSLAEFIHRINDEWVLAARRISPPVLRDLLAVTSEQVLALWRDTDLDATGEPVTWAGPDPAPVWLDCARDFTEYWVHRMQICEATGHPDRGGPQIVHRVLDTLLRAMPFTLLDLPRPDGTTLTLTVGGAAGGSWSWCSDGGRWWPAAPGPGPSTVIAVDRPDPLWRLCVRMIEPADAARAAVVTGDREVADVALRIVSIIR